MNVLVPPRTLLAGTVIALDASEAHHLRVRRAGADAAVTLFDGDGGSASGAIRLGGDGISVLVGAVRQMPRPPVTLLAVGAGDRDRFLALAERCTELGVTHLLPLRTGRTEGVDTRIRDASLDKARRRAREACKQCENPWATVIGAFSTLADLAEHHAGMRWRVGALGGGRAPDHGAEQNIGWIIGPEGGLTDDELAFAADHLAAVPVSFGPAILRFETAAIAAATITLDRRRAT